MARNRDVSHLPPTPVENVIQDLCGEMRLIERAVETFRFDMESVGEVAERGEPAFPTWKHTSCCAALGRYGEFREIDILIYANARLDRIKKKIARLITANRRQIREWESQGLRAERARTELRRLEEESAEEWR